MFSLHNGMHRNTITEADCFNAHKTNKKKTNAKIIHIEIPFLGFS